MLTCEENEALTRTCPGAHMGEVMRRYSVPTDTDWHEVLLREMYPSGV